MITGRRLQFSSRSLVLVAALVCLACSIWSAGRRYYTEQREAVAFILGKEPQLPWRAEAATTFGENLPNRMGSVSWDAKPNRFALLRWLYANNDVVHVTYLGVEGDGPVARFFDRMDRFPFLERLSLSSPRLADRDVERLAQIRTLRAVTIDSDAVTGVGFGKLVPLPNLSSVGLYSQNLTKEGLGEVCRIPSLTGITLRFGSASALSDLSPLFEARALRSVTLWGRFGDSALATLGALPGLESAAIAPSDPAAISDQGLRDLCRSRSLSFLNISGRFTDAAIPDLTTCTSLKTLLIQDSATSNEGRSHLEAARPDMSITIDAPRANPNERSTIPDQEGG